MATSRLRLTPGAAYLYDGTEGVYQVITGQATALVLDNKVAVSGNLLLTGSAYFKNQESSPTPGGSEAVIYAREGTMYFKNSGGSETPFGSTEIPDGDRGDITVSSGGSTWTIDNNTITAPKISSNAVITAKINNSAVTYAKIQNVTSTDRLLGRASAGAGPIQEIICTSAGRALLDDVDAAAQRTTLGLGDLATQGDGDKGDITVASSGASWTVDNAAITNSKLANMSQATVKGRASAAGTGAPVDLTSSQLTTIVAASSGGGTTNFLRADGSWAAPAGTGDVTGPASSTATAIARFNGGGGKTLQDSGVTISDLLSNTLTVAGIAGTNTLNLFNGVSTTINFAGASTNLSMGAATGDTYVKNNLNVSGNLVYNSQVRSSRGPKIVTNADSSINDIALYRYVIFTGCTGSAVCSIPDPSLAPGRVITIYNDNASQTVTITAPAGKQILGRGNSDNTFILDSGYTWVEICADVIADNNIKWFIVNGGIVPAQPGNL